ncbi:neurobeachin-like isoform X5 [Diadema antillarum]|uniref:neurobeachin-like isoform X5 n=1 Tax=Diadema antillarum TaxID=105358 RepID=UPI003A869016
MAAEGSGEAETPKKDVIAENMPATGTAKMKFGVLIGLIEVGEIANRDIVDTVLDLLVGGRFDLESNFIIQEPDNISHMVEMLSHCAVTLQAEILSMFVAILRKSYLNLQACSEVSIIEKLVERLPSSDEMIADLLVEIIGVLAIYSISVKELKLIFSSLKGAEGHWPRHSVRLLQALRQIPRRHGPDITFSFPGKDGAAIALPPIARWPYQNGFTFSTWFRVEPVNTNIERDKPYLYCFRTSKGVGYSGHFMGSCLVVTSVKVKGKGFQHCIKYDFQPRKWYMVTVVHVYNRWRTSEIKCYVNGQLVSSGEMQWYVNTSDPYDKCFLGSAPTADKERTFSGQLSSVYLFSEAVSPQCIHGMYLLGPNYRSHFKFPSESDVSLPDQYKKVLYDGKLTSSIVFLYNPAATESQLCLESSPKGNPSFFVHSPHALMVQDVRAIVTHSIHSTLHSIGGIHMLFPIFTQLDFNHQEQGATSRLEGENGSSVCPLLLGLLCDLLKGSMSTQQQMVHGRGFIILGYILQKASPRHMTGTVLELFLDLAKHFNNLPTGIQLLRHLVDHILFNPSLWIHTPIKVQISLYTFLANEFVGQAAIYTNIRRVSTVLQLMHTLKHYYWIVNPESRSGIVPKGLDGNRPSLDDLLTLRALILRVTKQLILKEKSANDEELQIILNYLMTMHEMRSEVEDQTMMDLNLKDVLQLLLSLMAENINGLAVAFDRKNGIRTVFKLLASSDEAIRALSLKCLSLFLSRLPHKRKMDLMYAHNLYSLLGERMQLTSNTLTLTMYNCLFELLTERVSLQVMRTRHPEPDKTYRVMNPGMFHVIARLLRQSVPSTESMDVRRLFLSDMILLFNNSRENRRILLQCSVWQDWMISLSYIYPKNEEEKRISEMVYSLLRMLLHHAMKYEWGGWRVWVDTLSILHSKVSLEDHKNDLLKAYTHYQNQQGEDGSPRRIPLNISEAVVAATRPGTSGAQPDHSISALAAMTGGDGFEYEVIEDDPNNPYPPRDRMVTEAELEKRRRDLEVRDFLNEVINKVVTIVGSGGSGEGATAASPSSADGEEESTSPSNDSPAVLPLANITTNEQILQADFNTQLPLEEQVRQMEVGASGGSGGGDTPTQRVFSPGPHQAPYRIPEFQWSHMHQRMMSDLLFAIETDVQVWRSHSTRTVIDYVNAGENTIFVQNVTQMISQIMDVLIYSCGGILPLLSAATSRNQQDPDIVEPTQNLPLDVGISFINRIMNLVDVLVFASNQNFGELEAEKSVARGGILRQCLRLTCFCAIRNVLECRYRMHPSPSSSTVSLNKPTPAEPGTPTGSIHTLIQATQPSPRAINNVRLPGFVKNIVENLASPMSPVRDLERLLQDMDIHRLRAVVYRDVEESKQAQFLALAIVYFISVLMVARYRDILDSDNSPALSRQNSIQRSQVSSAQDIEQEMDNRATPTLPVRPSAVEGARDAPQQVAPTASQAPGVGGGGDGVHRKPVEARKEPVGAASGDPGVKQERAKLESASTDAGKETELPGDNKDARRVPAEKEGAMEQEDNKMSEVSPSDPPSQDGSTAGEEKTDKEKEVHDEESDKKRDSEDIKSCLDDKKTVSPDDIIPMAGSDGEVSGKDVEEMQEVSLENGSLAEEDDDDEEEETKAPTPPTKDTDTASPIVGMNNKVEGKASSSDIEAGVSMDSEAASAVPSKGPQAISSISSMASEKVGESDEKRALHTWPWTGTKNGEQLPDHPAPSMAPVPDAPTASASSDGPTPTPLPQEIQEKAGLYRPPPLDLSSMRDGAVGPSLAERRLASGASEGTVEERLTKALETAAPLLREIFLDFAPFLSKTLLGSHGQELLIEGLITMKSSNSVIELVMMLCSQEWQNSIQKHAGLAFIELVNEGRLYSGLTREHLLRVANEAEFILSRHRAEDVQKHAEFESLCAQTSMDCREEEKMCDHLITAAKRRDHILASQLIQKTLNILTNKHGAWGNKSERPQEFFRLDMWEDNTRRHRRLVRNPYGSSHSEAALKAAIEHGEPEDVVEKAKQALHAQIAAKQRTVPTSELDEDDTSLQEDAELENELEGPVVYTTTAHMIAPCVVVKGTLSITSAEMYFEVDEEDNTFKEADPKVLQYTDGLHGRWHFNDIRAVFSRRYLLQNTAVEIFLANRTSVMFSLPNKATVKKVVHALPRVGVGLKYGIPASRANKVQRFNDANFGSDRHSQSRHVSLATPRQLFKASNMTAAWQRREISNFEYLMYLNTIAGRTYNDLNQYPVFPWVLTNYDSQELDLTLPSNYRDLSKPMGALNPSRKAFFQERYENWEDDKIPPFHYGTHYSTLGFTLMWLMRLEPYTTYFLNLQGGKFDHASRTFSSMATAWKNCQRDTSDVKELIPEFYYLPEMFCNSNGYRLGNLDDGSEVNDVILPPWAKSPEDFIRINRLALESEFVSCQLHQWIDLIFGYKQRGLDAVRSTNVFYYLTYEGSIDLESIDDPVMREAIENQIRSFGQTPAQLLTEPHPPRSSAMHLSPMMYTDQLQQEVLMIIKFLSNSPVIHVAANTSPMVPTPAIITVACNQTFAMNRWNNQTAGVPGTPGYSMDAGKNLLIELDPLVLSQTGMHRRQILEAMDSNIKSKASCYVATADNRYIMACGFWDKSFRVFLTDTCKVTQVVYGHWDMVTCLGRSECPVGGDCYIVSGSRDATLLVWHWSAKQQWVLGDNHVHGEVATPRAILTGHDTEVISVAVCTELGLVVSGSKGGACLVHTVSGDLLQSLTPPAACKVPRLCSIAAEQGVIIVTFDKGNICSYTLNGRFLNLTDVQANLHAVKMKPEGDYFVTGGDNRVVQVWRTHDHKLMHTFPLCDASILALDLAHEQRTIIAGMATGSIVAFHVNFQKWHHEYREAY